MSARDVNTPEESVRRNCERLREHFRCQQTARIANSVDRIRSNSLQEQTVSASVDDDAAVARDAERIPGLDKDERLARTAAWVDRNPDIHSLPDPNSSSSSGAVPIPTGPSKMQDPSYGVLQGLVSTQQTRRQHCQRLLTMRVASPRSSHLQLSISRAASP